MVSRKVDSLVCETSVDIWFTIDNDLEIKLHENVFPLVEWIHCHNKMNNIIISIINDFLQTAEARQYYERQIIDEITRHNKNLDGQKYLRNTFEQIKKANPFCYFAVVSWNNIGKIINMRHHYNYVEFFIKF